ncbi:hypothetical protein RM550_03120 [Streptomyces sp. DSM 41527]|uniref:Uncharacterized protein n=1 Tax=Streptomyces mooreae TaxID=3075523 RepID=A0ABU2T0X1_9ACTN|nr:hypothetical protein [Streptomyces sp. DSM 41527]MDT0454732.1 hypothetical protein [Streptomyces sp. DSM 41527]
MKKIIAIAFITALLGAGSAGIASAATAPPGPPPPGRDLVTTTFHCPGPHSTFRITADPWVMGQYEWYYGEHGCTYTS